MESPICAEAVPATREESRMPTSAFTLPAPGFEDAIAPCADTSEASCRFACASVSMSICVSAHESAPACAHRAACDPDSASRASPETLDKSEACDTVGEMLNRATELEMSYLDAPMSASASPHALPGARAAAAPPSLPPLMAGTPVSGATFSLGKPSVRGGEPGVVSDPAWSDGQFPDKPDALAGEERVRIATGTIGLVPASLSNRRNARARSPAPVCVLSAPSNRDDLSATLISAAVAQGVRTARSRGVPHACTSLMPTSTASGALPLASPSRSHVGSPSAPGRNTPSTAGSDG
mmetsp:Transcript_31778/g.102645  ORF Transcript_31778/g.102645 Transcript_31778/m.102645 type:complete len:295 (+) Transcript_31778:1497-2381(+)|eukprot:scaffold12884_cov111-Isochrysis_galbana.AAC.9